MLKLYSITTVNDLDKHVLLQGEQIVFNILRLTSTKILT